VRNALGITKKRTSGPIVQDKRTITKTSESEFSKKRQNIQLYFWNVVGSVEHISLPRLEDALRKEFNCRNDRFIQTQIRLMQTEGRIKIQNAVKVWIKQPVNLH
jgi:hypothetical protein